MRDEIRKLCDKSELILVGGTGFYFVTSFEKEKYIGLTRESLDLGYPLNITLLTEEWDEIHAEIKAGIIPWAYEECMFNRENKNYLLEDSELRKAILKRRKFIRKSKDNQKVIKFPSRQ